MDDFEILIANKLSKFKTNAFKRKPILLCLVRLIICRIQNKVIEWTGKNTWMKL